jgi:putative transcriptional regulator
MFLISSDHLCGQILSAGREVGKSMAKFTCNLRKYRQLADMTQEDLAARVNVRRETIVRLEAGKYNPSLKLAIDISRAVKAPIEDIFIFD